MKKALKQHIHVLCLCICCAILFGNLSLTAFAASEYRDDITGSVIWDDQDNQDGMRPDSVQINLYKYVSYGKKEFVASVSTDSTKNWQYSFTNIDKYTDGMEIQYLIIPEEISSYYSSVDGETKVTFFHAPEKISSIDGVISWIDENNQDGRRPSQVTIRLFSNGEEISSKRITNSEHWEYSFEDLPKYANGQKIIYTLALDAIDDYTTEINGYNVTNTYMPETVNINDSITWADQNDQDGKRPSQVTIRLFADNTEIQTITTDSVNDWEYQFTNLPKFQNGSEIKYTLKQDDIDEYTTVIDENYHITNTHAVEKTEIQCTALWDDQNDSSGKRPKHILVHLFADGREYGQPVKLSESNHWSYTFTNLSKWNAGNAVTYTVEFENVSGYTKKLTDEADNSYQMTYTLISKDDKEPTESENPSDKFDSNNNKQEDNKPEGNKPEDNKPESNKDESSDKAPSATKPDEYKGVPTGDSGYVLLGCILLCMSAMIILDIFYIQKYKKR